MSYYQNSGGSSSDEIWSWIFIVFAFAAFWPLGIFLLFRKIFGLGKTSGKTGGSQSGTPYNPTWKNSGSTGNYTYSAPGSSGKTGSYAAGNTYSRPGQNTSSGAKTGSYSAASTANSVSSNNGKKRLSGNVIGVCLVIISVILFALAADFLTSGIGNGDMSEVLRGAFYLAGGGATLGFRRAFLNRRKRFSKYTTIMGKNSAISVKQLAKTTGIAEKTVRKDLDSMIDSGFFGQSAYFDVGLDSVVLSPDAAEKERERRIKEDRENAAKNAPENEYMSILSELRSLNDSISDPVITSKISNIEALAAKIFRLVEEKPEKLPQIRKFMDYYLPSTLKLLRSYATLEHQGIEGDNITATKQNIARILDTLSTGYSQQLDALFRDDAIDISSDIDVLKMTMERDGLTKHDSPFNVKPDSKKAKTAGTPAAGQVMTSTGQIQNSDGTLSGTK